MSKKESKKEDHDRVCKNYKHLRGGNTRVLRKDQLSSKTSISTDYGASDLEACGVLHGQRFTVML